MVTVWRSWQTRLAGLGGVIGLLAALVAGPTHAHGTRVGDVVVDHPYALPSAPGATTGAVHFRALRNGGRAQERLLGAHTAAAVRVELQRAPRPGDSAGMRAVPALDIAPGAALATRHDGDVRLLLDGLATPLREGERFKLTLRFERGGEAEVTVWVQQPREPAARR